MPSPCFRRLAASLVLLGVPVAAARAEPPIVAKARAYLGTEAALTAVTSVHYSGTLVAPNSADPAKPFTATVDMVFQAPSRQRTVTTSSTLVDTTALDNYEAWHRAQNPKDASQWKLELLAAGSVKQQRAVVWENLAFFRGLERQGGKVLDQGQATIDGVVCRKLAFVHGANLTFTHYFDEATGRLVLTETDTGATIREQGEVMVHGIRFAKVLVNTTPGPGGKPVTVTVTWDKITVNESFPDALFAVPPFTAK